MVSDLFHNTLEAASLMGESSTFMDSLQTVVQNLAPMQVGRWGQLQEWMEDWDNPKDRHRHTSHLWGLYPGRQITQNTPILLKQPNAHSKVAETIPPVGLWDGKSVFGHGFSMETMLIS